MTRRLLLTITSAALAAGAAGCGGEPAGGGAQARTTSEDAQLAFARCMREEGIDIEDPGSGREGRVRARIRPGAAPGSLRTSIEKCRKQTGGGPPVPTAQERQEFRDAALKFAKCMRANGVNVPDPQGDGLIIRAQRGRNELNPDSPAFRRAHEKCQSHLPEPRRGGGAGGAATEVPAP